MPKVLTQERIDRYHEDGYVFPIRVMSESDALELRRGIEAFEKTQGAPLQRDIGMKSHLLFTRLAEVIRNSKMLDAVEDLYGPNLMCWTTSFFLKDARTPSFVSWHQDSTYWGLDKPDVVTAWLAITPSNLANGAMQFMPRSHTADQIPHRDTFSKDNMLTRGQEVAVEVDESKAVAAVLEPGEISLHHVRLVHGSPPNPSNDRRMGFAIRYMPTYVKQTTGEDSATLVRGTDTYHHFELEPRPTSDMQPEFVALHKRITNRKAQILYRGIEVGTNDPTERAAAQRERAAR